MRSLPVRASLLVPVRPGRTFCVLVPSLYRDGRTGHPRTTACSSPAAARPDLAPLNLPALVRAGLLERVRAWTRAAVPPGAPGSPLLIPCRWTTDMTLDRPSARLWPRLTTTQQRSAP